MMQGMEGWSVGMECPYMGFKVLWKKALFKLNHKVIGIYVFESPNLALQLLLLCQIFG